MVALTDVAFGPHTSSVFWKKKILWKLYPHLHHAYMPACLTRVAIYGACGHAVDERGLMNKAGRSLVYF
jgi:hypothetical protein